MTESQPSQKPVENMLSEAAVDGLLRDFFRLEVPAEALSRVPARPASAVGTATVIRSRGGIARRMVVAVSLTVLPLCLLLIFSNDSGPGVGTGLAEKQIVPASTEQLLPVSSAAGVKATDVPLDENGLLLEETDQIQLNPQK